MLRGTVSISHSLDFILWRPLEFLWEMAHPPLLCSPSGGISLHSTENSTSTHWCYLFILSRKWGDFTSTWDRTKQAKHHSAWLRRAVLLFYQPRIYRGEEDWNVVVLLYIHLIPVQSFFFNCTWHSYILKSSNNTAYSLLLSSRQITCSPKITLLRLREQKAIWESLWGLEGWLCTNKKTTKPQKLPMLLEVQAMTPLVSLARWRSDSS